VSFACAQ